MSNKYIIGIDPGCTESGWCTIGEDYKIVGAGKTENNALMTYLKIWIRGNTIDEVVVESLQSYGMTMGKSTIETAYFIGRIQQCCIDFESKIYLYPRPEYGKAIICGNKVNDSLIRTALELRFGGYKKDQPLAKLAGATDKRSAFAVACYHLDKMKEAKKNA